MLESQSMLSHCTALQTVSSTWWGLCFRGGTCTEVKCPLPASLPRCKTRVVNSLKRIFALGQVKGCWRYHSWSPNGNTISPFLCWVAWHVPRRRKSLYLLPNPVFPTSIGLCFFWNLLPIFLEHHSPKQSVKRSVTYTSKHLLGSASPNLFPKATPATWTSRISAERLQKLSCNK